jgi:hypothetical protein
MKNVIYAATDRGYCVQVLDGGQTIYEYTAGNHQSESQTFVDPRSRNAVRLRQLKRWAKQTAGEIATEHEIPAHRIGYDADLEAAIREQEQ